MTALMHIGKAVTGVFQRHSGKKPDAGDGVVELEDDVDASEFEDDLPDEKSKPKSRRPKETKFTQQRIASWNPVFTPKMVMPIYFFLAVLFLIFGGVMLNNSAKVDEIFVYYQDCDKAAPTANFEDVPEDHYSYIFHKSYDKDELAIPQWKYVPDENPDPEETQTGTCQLRFSTPYEQKGPIFFYYLIENFYGNHRRYVLSFSEFQITGKNATLSQLKDTVGVNCKPLVRNHEGKFYYPCGLIANAMFNDTFPDSLSVISLDDDDKDTGSTIALSNKNINWATDKKRYKKTEYSASQIVPPPFWKKKFPDGYNDTNIPDIKEWEEFQNWMRTPAFPKFSRLIRRTESSLPEGEFQIDIGLHWPVTMYNGKKAVYITGGSSLGGKNNFLGIVYLVGGGLSIALAIISALSYLLWGRASADSRLLSWNK